MRVLELYAGIGGCAAALSPGDEVALAIEQSDVALSVYRAHHPHPTLEKNLSGIAYEVLEKARAELWWLSPPCQSFTKRGAQRDVDDPRAQSLLRLLPMIERAQPRHVALENVPGFETSRAHDALLETLRGYQVHEQLLCPTELGIPSRRLRYYLVASQDSLQTPALTKTPRTLASFLDPDDDPGLVVDEAVVNKYAWAMQILERSDPAAETTCFTSAYGRSPVRSGAYLLTPRGVRLFSPAEVLRLLGFPEGFVIPHRRAYALAGNSLSVFAVRHVLSALTPTAPGATHGSWMRR